VTQKLRTCWQNPCSELFGNLKELRRLKSFWSTFHQWFRWFSAGGPEKPEKDKISFKKDKKNTYLKNEFVLNTLICSSHNQTEQGEHHEKESCKISARQNLQSATE
jgi:hypothetical protein